MFKKNEKKVFGINLTIYICEKKNVLHFIVSTPMMIMLWPSEFFDVKGQWIATYLLHFQIELSLFLLVMPHNIRNSIHLYFL